MHNYPLAEVTYDQLQTAIAGALSLHAVVNDPMLLSAVERLTPCLDADDADAIALTRSATVAYAFVQRMEDARATLYGH